jgi:taurine dioxygenase/sulfonate dioxygenase
MSLRLVTDENGILRLPKEEYDRAKYPEWLPVWNPEHQFPALTENKNYVDRAFFADPSFSNLFPSDSHIDKIDLSPGFGTEIRSGVQLSMLSDAAKDEVALLLAQRGFLIFRDQDLKDKGFEFNKKLGEYFGPLHVTSFSGAPENETKFHVVYRSPDQEINVKKISGIHTDDNWEVFTPGVTIFAILDGPSTGGDTLFVDSQEIYERFTPTFQKILGDLSAIFSNVEASNANGESKGFLRTPPTETSHPVVRIHPVTQKKNIFFSLLTKRLEGLDEEESALILGYLKNKIYGQPDLHLRARWEPGTVVLWDNRRCLHTALADFEGSVRHCYRVTTFAEAPVGNFEELEEETKRLSQKLQEKLRI